MVIFSAGKAQPAAEPQTAPPIVTGHVFFLGHPPPRKLVVMSKEPFCQKYYKTRPRYEDLLVINHNHTVRDTVVFIESGVTQKNFPARPPVVLDQYNCWFRPHVLAVMVGQKIKAINDDPNVTHNFHFLTKINPPLNFTQPGEIEGGRFPFKIISFYQPEMIPVKCDIHPWMNGVVAVMANPYFSVTKSDGSFSITGLPPGNYTLEAWQQALGAIKKSIKVVAGKKLTVNFSFK